MNRRSGLTLVEVMIALGALILITLAIFVIVERGSSTYADSTRHNTLQENARRVLDQMTQELRLANPATLVVGTSNGAGFISFQVSTGFSAGVTSWSSTIEYLFEASDVDANNNSKKDEGRLVRLQDKTSLRLCDYVKAGGFTVTKSGTTLALTLTLQVADEKNKIMETKVSTSVVLRNKSGA